MLVISVLEWKLANEISNEEFSLLYLEWMKSRKLKEPLIVYYEEGFHKDEFFLYILNNYSNSDSELSDLVYNDKILFAHFILLDFLFFKRNP